MMYFSSSADSHMYLTVVNPRMMQTLLLALHLPSANGTVITKLFINNISSHTVSNNKTTTGV